MNIINPSQTSLVSGGADVLIEYFVSAEDLEDGKKKLSVWLDFVGEEDDILECCLAIFR